jgi:mRNA interferase MazF
MRRGELYRVRHPAGDPRRSRVFVVVSRQALADSAFSTVICAPVFTEGHGLSTQVPIGTAEGFKHVSVVFCDNLVSVAKTALTDYVGTLRAATLAAVDQALRVALEL